MLLVVHGLHGLAAWFLAAFAATVGYVLVLALELELATTIRRPGRQGGSWARRESGGALASVVSG